MAESELRLSLLDTLLDDEAPTGPSVPYQRDRELGKLRAAVRRDLEALLNARQRPVGWPGALGELETSLLNYGIPDLAGVNMASERQRNRFRDAVEAAIRRFEPRLRECSITVLESLQPADRTLRFRISAKIAADPAPIPVVYDSVLDTPSRTFSVTSGK